MERIKKHFKKYWPVYILLFFGIIGILSVLAVAVLIAIYIIRNKYTSANDDSSNIISENKEKRTTINETQSDNTHLENSNIIIIKNDGENDSIKNERIDKIKNLSRNFLKGITKENGTPKIYNVAELKEKITNFKKDIFPIKERQEFINILNSYKNEDKNEDIESEIRFMNKVWESYEDYYNHQYSNYEKELKLLLLNDVEIEKLNTTLKTKGFGAIPDELIKYDKNSMYQVD